MQAAKGSTPSRLRYLADNPRFLSASMLLPAVTFIVLLIGVPFVLALLLSFSDARTGSLSFSFVGFKNFVSIWNNSLFQTALRNTLIFTLVSQALVLTLAVTLATVLSKSFRGKWLVRFLILLPWAAPIALGTLGWLWIFDSTFSVLNWTLKSLGFFGLRGWLYWLGEPGLAMTAIIIVHVWRMMPFSTVILLAGMTAIPQDIQDAASVDGAGFWRRLFEVTLPMLLPIASVSVLFGTVFTFTDMSVVYLLTRGGPYNSTHVLSSLAFQQGILGSDLGQGSAIALFLFPVLVLAAVVMLRTARRSGGEL